MPACVIIGVMECKMEYTIMGAAAVAAFGALWVVLSRKSVDTQTKKKQAQASLRARYLRDHPEDEQAWKRKSKDRSGDFGRR